MKRPEKKRRGLQQIEELASRIPELAEEDAKILPLPTGISDAVIKAFDRRPSRNIGEIKKALEAAIETGEIDPQQPAEAYVELSAKDARFGI